MMRTIPIIALVMIACLASVRAQPGAPAPIDIRLLNADYPVPLPAALVALDDGAPDLLEPYTVRYASAAARAMTAGAGSFAFGAEVAPLLVGNAVDLATYLSSRPLRVLLRTRVSFAAESVDGGGVRSAFGLRWMLHDDADLRADSSFSRAIDRIAPEHRAAAYDSLRDALKDLLWNRSVFEIAAAATYRTGAAGEPALAVTGYRAYFGCGFPIVGASDQLQAGIAYARVPHDDVAGTDVVGLFARMLYGSPSERAFAGLNLDVSDASAPEYRVQIGLLLRIANGVWLRPDVGGSLGVHAARSFQARLVLSLGTPELR
jgi:hypothetical protein